MMKESAHLLANDFIEQAKSSGLVAQAIADAGLAARPAPLTEQSETVSQLSVITLEDTASS